MKSKKKKSSPKENKIIHIEIKEECGNDSKEK